MGLITVLLGAMLGSFLTGYVSALISSTLGQPSWYRTMHLSGTGQKTTDIISAANGLFYAGGFFGTLFTSYFAEKWGRLFGFKVAAGWHVLGGVLQTAAVNQAMYLVSRFLAGFAVGQTTAAMIVYYSEISPPNKRGEHSGLHALMIQTGACLASWIGLGCYYSKIGTFGWRFPISLSILQAIMLFAISFWLPESPRWLVRHGKLDEAYVTFMRLHGTNSDNTLADREFQQVKIQSEADQEQIDKHGKWQLFTEKAYRNRLIIGFFLVGFVQSCGFLVIFNYGVILYTALGFSTAESLIASSGWISWTAVCILIGNRTVDKIGRRRSLMVGFVSLSASLAIFTACLKYYLETEKKTYAAVAVTFIYVAAIPFGFCLDNNQFTVVAEIFPNHMRTLSCSICTSCLYLMQVLWLNLAPTAINNIRWKFYLIFVILGFCGSIHVYIFIPETKNVPLEELDAIFGRTVAVRLEDIDESAPGKEGIATTHRDNISADGKTIA